MLHVHVQGRGGEHTSNHGLTADCLYNVHVHVAVFLKLQTVHWSGPSTYPIRKFLVPFLCAVECGRERGFQINFILAVNQQ